MTDPQNHIIIFSATCLLIGMIIGYLLSSMRGRNRLEKTVQRCRKEAEAEKLEISRDLNKQLVQVKDSIVKTVEAYSSVARTIQDKLPIPPEFEALYSRNSNVLKLENSIDEKKVKDDETNKSDNTATDEVKSPSSDKQPTSIEASKEVTQDSLDECVPASEEVNSEVPDAVTSITNEENENPESHKLESEKNSTETPQKVSAL
jgi:hypothetical protein